MRIVVAAALLVLSAFTGFGQEAKVEMEHYVVAFLKRGPKWTPEVTEETRRIQSGHMANIRRMADSGKLVLAGPFEDNTELRGMFIFRCSLDEAKKEAAQDPAVQAGRLVLEFHPWFSARGIGILKDK
jgi:uncharacterized protein